MLKQSRLLSALIAIFFAYPAYANTPSDRCLEATAILSNTLGMSQAEIDHFKSVRASECGSDAPAPADLATTSAAQAGITEMLQMLRDEGIDIDARMERAQAQCRSRFASGALPAGMATREEAITGCSVVEQQAVYARAINELHNNRQSSYRREVARHNAQVDEAERRQREHQRQLQERDRRIAAERDAAERRMAEWRRAVELCKQGKRQYCAPKSD